MHYFSYADLLSFEKQAQQIEKEITRSIRPDSVNVQPLHTFYVGAHTVTPHLYQEWIEIWNQYKHNLRLILLSNKEQLFRPYANTAQINAVPETIIDTITEVTLERITTKPVQDIRFDFEDGYRSLHSESVTEDCEKTSAFIEKNLDYFSTVGIRIPGVGPNELKNTLAILEIMSKNLVRTLSSFRITLPKFYHREQLRLLSNTLLALERKMDIRTPFFYIEIQVEKGLAVGEIVSATVAELQEISHNRLLALHFGTYDFGKSLKIDVPLQSTDHEISALTTALLQIVTAETGIWVSDGSSQLIPKDPSDIQMCSQLMGQYLRSLQRGQQQGWDIHPAQIVYRWLANCAHHLTQVYLIAPRLTDSILLENKQSPLYNLGYLDEPATISAMSRSLMAIIEKSIINWEWLTRQFPHLERDTIIKLAQQA